MHKILGEKSRTAVALHHSQVAEKPFNFFVLNRNLLHNNTKDYGTFCNAKIIEKDLSTKMTMWEGCLSWPFRKTIKKQRYARVKVAYDVMIDDLNIPGKVILKHEEAWVEGLIAQIFQHEIDHANGIHIY